MSELLNLVTISSNCDRSKAILSSDEKILYIMKKPKSFATLPETVSLDTILGISNGGPGGRRINDPEHCYEKYLEFIDLIKYVLLYLW